MSAGAGRSLPVRMLGYGGTALLISLAIGILVVTFTGNGRTGRAGSTAAGSGGTGSGTGATTTLVPVPRDPATAPPERTSPTEGGSGSGSGGTGAGTGGSSGAGGRAARPHCATGTAGYTRFGDDLTVRVKFTGTGYVSTFVELTGRGTLSKSASGSGNHVFKFTDAPANLTQAVGLTTISKLGLSTCEVQPAG